MQLSKLSNIINKFKNFLSTSKYQIFTLNSKHYHAEMNNLEQIRTKPFIVICGCTGTGKTKLSIELAEWLIKNNKKGRRFESRRYTSILF